MIQKQIYSPWAYTPNADEKRKMNIEIYNELKEKYKIAYGLTKWNPEKKSEEPIVIDEYDIVIKFSSSGYAHTRYKILKNKPKLSPLELALICDRGNLCFGHDIRGGEICIYID